MKVIGETEFVNGAAAMAASGRYGKIKACEGIVSRADLSLGSAVGRVLDAHIAAGNGRFRGIRHAAAWDASPDVRNSHTNPPEHLYALPKFREGLKELAKRNSPSRPGGITQCPTSSRPARCRTQGSCSTTSADRSAFHRTPASATRCLRCGRAASRNSRPARNVYVKLGGLGMTICGFGFGKRDVLPGSEELAQVWRPYLETCIEAFGVNRGMLESNFPVDGASCSYQALWNAFKRVTKGASAADKAALYRNTAVALFARRLRPSQMESRCRVGGTTKSRH